MRSFLYIGDYEYLKRVRNLIKEAKLELQESDQGRNREKLIQAGEKIHNAINNLIYLLKQREYGDHEWIRRQIEEITYVDERTKIRLITINDTLHANFYHYFLDYKSVKDMSNDAILIINGILEKYHKRNTVR